MTFLSVDRTAPVRRAYFQAVRVVPKMSRVDLQLENAQGEPKKRDVCEGDAPFRSVALRATLGALALNPMTVLLSQSVLSFIMEEWGVWWWWGEVGRNAQENMYTCHAVTTDSYPSHTRTAFRTDGSMFEDTSNWRTNTTDVNSFDLHSCLTPPCYSLNPVVCDMSTCLAY